MFVKFGCRSTITRDDSKDSILPMLYPLFLDRCLGPILNAHFSMLLMTLAEIYQIVREILNDIIETFESEDDLLQFEASHSSDQKDIIIQVVVTKLLLSIQSGSLPRSCHMDHENLANVPVEG